MPEYIEREAALLWLKQYKDAFAKQKDPLAHFIAGGLDECINRVKKIPAADVEPVKGWISVKDRLPDQYVDVLLHCRTISGPKVRVAHIEDDGTWHDTWDIEWFYPKESPCCWMPLPKPVEEHAEWIDKNGRRVCSKCGYDKEKAKNLSCCPNCGAKMDLKEGTG